MIDFRNVKNITISNGNVKSIKVNNQIIWGKIVKPSGVKSYFKFTPGNNIDDFDYFDKFKLNGTNLQVDWGDGNKEVINGEVEHTYTITTPVVLNVSGIINNMKVNEKITELSLGKNNITDMNNMFYRCGPLTTISTLDTSNVTNMNDMFWDCERLTTIPLLNTSKVTNMSSMFGGCKSLTTIPLLDTSNVTNMRNMFYSCFLLTSIPLLNTNNVTKMDDMFAGCTSLTTIPLLNTSKVTNMSSMFAECSSLTTIPVLNTSKVTNMYGMFFRCTNIEEINMININADLDISPCQKMQQPALHKIIDNLKQQTSGRKTLTLGATLLARVSDEYKTKANQKGWDLK